MSSRASFGLRIIFFIIISGCSTQKSPVAHNPISTENTSREVTTGFSEQSTWLLGYFDLGRLLMPPYSEWYIRGFENYQPDQKYIDKLIKTDKENVKITVVLGTWCPDSRRELPRFMKIIDLAGFPVEKITMIGTDDEKISPVGDYENLDIQKVPTFIFYRNNFEAGRIIENPLTSLEQDMTDILNRNE